MNAEVVRLVPLTDRELEDIQFSAMDKMLELNRNLKTKKNITTSTAEIQKEITRLGKVVEKCSNYSRGRS